MPMSSIEIEDDKQSRDALLASIQNILIGKPANTTMTPNVEIESAQTQTSATPSALAARNPLKLARDVSDATNEGRCQRCGITTHVTDKCPTIVRFSINKTPHPGYTCPLCDVQGKHFKDFCPAHKPTPIVTKAQGKQDSKAPITTESSKPRVVIDLCGDSDTNSTNGNAPSRPAKKPSLAGYVCLNCGAKGKHREEVCPNPTDRTVRPRYEHLSAGTQQSKKIKNQVVPKTTTKPEVKPSPQAAAPLNKVKPGSVPVNQTPAAAADRSQHGLETLTAQLHDVMQQLKDLRATVTSNGQIVAAGSSSSKKVSQANAAMHEDRRRMLEELDDPKDTSMIECPSTGPVSHGARASSADSAQLPVSLPAVVVDGLQRPASLTTTICSNIHKLPITKRKRDSSPLPQAKRRTQNGPERIGTSETWGPAASNDCIEPRDLKRNRGNSPLPNACLARRRGEVGPNRLIASPLWSRLAPEGRMPGLEWFDVTQDRHNAQMVPPFGRSRAMWDCLESDPYLGLVEPYGELDPLWVVEMLDFEADQFLIDLAVELRA